MPDIFKDEPRMSEPQAVTDPVDALNAVRSKHPTAFPDTAAEGEQRFYVANAGMINRLLVGHLFTVSDEKEGDTQWVRVASEAIAL